MRVSISLAVALTTLFCGVDFSQAQSGSSQYRSTSALAYNDIIGELEPADGDWFKPPTIDSPSDFDGSEFVDRRFVGQELEPQSGLGSHARSSTGSEFPPLALTNSAPNLAPANRSAQPDGPILGNPGTNQSHTPTDWRRTEAGRLWDTSAGRDDEGPWGDGDVRLQFGIDYLYFTRGAAADNFFASNNAGETFSLADIDIGTESAIRYRLLLATVGGTGFELLGYDFEEFSGSLLLQGEGITPEFFGLIPADPVTEYNVSYESRLRNFEANVSARRSERLKIGYGLRYVNLEENFDIQFA